MGFWASLDRSLGLPNRGDIEKEKDLQRKAINEQIKAYKDQTELTRQEVNNKRDQVASEKRRVEEKQVRSLRRNNRAPGFLGGGESSQPDMTSKLGG